MVLNYLKISYLCRNVGFRSKQKTNQKIKIKNKKKVKRKKQADKNNNFIYKTLSEWNGILTGTHDTNQSKVWMCEVCSATWGRELSTSNLWCLYLTRLVLLGFRESVQPAGVPFTPKSSWALTLATLALKAELFSAQAQREPPCSLPPATSHSATEITLFILCIIVSSWMQKLCRHLSELNQRACMC